MSTHYFTGKVSWAKFNSPDKFGKYSVTVALDMKQFKEMKDLGLKNGGKPDDEGKMLVTFRSPSDKGPPLVVDAEGKTFTKDVGNGSLCTVAIEVEKFVSKIHGNVTRSTLTKVRVDEWVEYVKEEQTVAAATMETPSSLPTPKGKMF